VPAEGSAVDLRTGDTVTATIEWDLRYAHMRCHTCLHLLCALIPFPVTGGSVRAGSGRLDFDIPQPILDKEELTAKLNELIARNAPVSFEYISEEELRGKPELVRTLEVGPPARGGKIRLVRIEGIDLQPCGGSHLRSTSEIGRARVVKMEKKGRQNRRVEVAIEDA
jgi:misacylated tRNA(Ala) deacylase